MSDRCARCGASLPAEAAFCPTCGQPVGSATVAATPTPAHPASAPPTPPPADPPAPPAPAPPGGPPTPEPALAAVGPPRALPGRYTAMIVGGIGLLFVLALVVVLAGPGGTEEPPPVVPGTTTTVASPPATPGSSPTNDPSPTGGSLRSLIAEQVGPFTLQAVERAAQLQGANERLRAVYRSADGTQVSIEVATYPSAADAERDRQLWKKALEAKAYKQVKEGPVRTTGGEQVGTVAVYRNQSEWVVWTNNHLSVAAVGPAGQAQAFYDASEY
jgi:zinc-ribbon domain